MAQAPLLPITDILNGKTNREIRMFVLFDNSALSYILTLTCLLHAPYNSKTYEMCCITAHGPVDVVCFVVGFSPCQAYLVLLFGKKVKVFAKAAAPPRTENGLYGTQER